MKEIDWDGSRDPLEIEVGEIECDLTLLAATAVEDLLQDNVKECIEDFRAAGIGVWMLTGDKGLTAKEIGVSCGLIPKQEGESQKTEKPSIFEFKEFYAEPEDLEKEAEKFVQESKTLGKNYQVLISGKVIAQALDNSGESIGELLLHAESVVVYRSSPL